MKPIPESRRGKILLAACIVLVVSLAAALTLGVLLAGGLDGGKDGGGAATGESASDSSALQGSSSESGGDSDTAAGGDPWKACREQGLSVSELFAYTGPNPDCGFEQGNDIAAVTVENTSGKYLLCAEITVASTTTPSCCWIFINLSFPLAGSSWRRRLPNCTCVERAGVVRSALGHR